MAAARTESQEDLPAMLAVIPLLDFSRTASVVLIAVGLAILVDLALERRRRSDEERRPSGAYLASVSCAGLALALIGLLSLAGG